ncbi:uncharacterized protein N0V89_001751 [Didymosphaeria variabile]|uniref:Uncharacterized protein n=1 Tax=Didymosphaeria variabile TaxID=1932322 RepID=A0A9W8XR83_9PLEO|nr:uncharacterized protein N0V89_001751 [Didymosphaeria variabile]KAJ4357176.1 hypothetical protein N0V89_001751 [Didymosphaeria variabile]
MISMSDVVSVSSWTANIAQFAAAPFLFLFSFIVASKFVYRPVPMEEVHVRTLPIDPERTFARKLLSGNPDILWRWTKGFLLDRDHARGSRVRLAATGALMSFLLTVLVLAGDKTLIGLLTSETRTLYDNVIPGAEPYGNSSFFLDDSCDMTTIIPDPYNLHNRSEGPPCSLDATTHPWSVVDPPKTYRLLAAGFPNITGNFTSLDFSGLEELYEEGKTEDRMVATHYDSRTNALHAFFLDISSLQQFQDDEDASRMKLFKTSDATNLGQDYTGTTTSVATTCISATQSCGLHNNTKGTTSIRYNCSAIFSGSLESIPTNGIDKMSGWNTSFYRNDNGIPREISVASQFNPFTYNVTGLINSYDLADLLDFHDPQGQDGSLVDAGNYDIAFALSCESTVYNVEYSMVSGNIYHFNATAASGQEAAVIKAPLQVGLGSYVLFQQASLGVLLTNITVPEAMGLAFSQVGLAYAAAAYTAKPSRMMRYRMDVRLARIPKAPYILLIVLCFLYAGLVLVFTIAACMAKRRCKVAETQALLMDREPSENCFC